MKKTVSVITLFVLVALIMVGISVRSNAADHLDAPLVAEDGRTDINDIYAFQSPANPDNTVLIMTVNPLAGVASPTTFFPYARYAFKIDNDGDGKVELEYRVRFNKPDSNGQQEVRLQVWELGQGTTFNQVVGETGQISNLPSGGQITAGIYDDPFFFDLVAFLDQVKGNGGGRTFCDGNEVDFFAGANVSAIVLEVPSDHLTDSSDVITVYGRTAVQGNNIDRMGIPAIATVLITDGNEDAFNAAGPRRDRADFGADVAGNLQFLSGLDGSGYSAAEAEFITNLLLPDVLTLDTSNSAGFVPGLNGRTLADDVIDFELFVVTGGLGAENEPAGTAVLDSDCVDGNDRPFNNSFPYLAAPHS